MLPLYDNIFSNSYATVEDVPHYARLRVMTPRDTFSRTTRSARAASLVGTGQ
jgi:hypothetical protein